MAKITIIFVRHGDTNSEAFDFDAKGPFLRNVGELLEDEPLPPENEVLFFFPPSENEKEDHPYTDEGSSEEALPEDKGFVVLEDESVPFGDAKSDGTRIEAGRNIFYGTGVPVFLSKKGRKDLTTLGAAFREAKIHIDCLVTGPLERTVESGATFKDGYGWEIDMHLLPPDERLIDVSYPAIEGREINENGEIRLGNGGMISIRDVGPLAAESLSDAGKRTAECLRELVREYLVKEGREEGVVAVISSQDNLAHGAANLEGRPDITPKELREEGKYLLKGEIEVFQLDGEGNLCSPVLYRPEMSEIVSLIKGASSGTENPYSGSRKEGL